MLFAVEPTPGWVRAIQALFGMLLAGWATQRATAMLRRTA
ncbi:hypothetical protein GCM10010404_23840 [Nonomuraea africana]|uniref:Uncharacterized protein n=1 Tax=Nonomuraea africana TaxID=46171 RepID=A0ABR9KMG7_9ACTN|nr:hypothetical protein [Nonomuraea africana]